MKIQFRTYLTSSLSKDETRVVSMAWHMFLFDTHPPHPHDSGSYPCRSVRAKCAYDTMVGFRTHAVRTERVTHVCSTHTNCAARVRLRTDQS